LNLLLCAVPVFRVLFSRLTLSPCHRVGTQRPVSLLKLFPRAHRPNIRYSIHRQNSIQMVNLVLQQFRQIPLFPCPYFLPLAAQILIAHNNLPVPLHLHENGQKAQATIPHHNLRFTPRGNLRIHQRPRLRPRQLQKNHPHASPNLRRRNSPPVSSASPPMRQGVRQIRHQPAKSGKPSGASR